MYTFFFVLYSFLLVNSNDKTLKDRNILHKKINIFFILSPNFNYLLFLYYTFMKL